MDAEAGFDMSADGGDLGDIDEERAWLRHDATATEEAAATITKVTGSKYRHQIVLALFRHRGGLTDDGMAEVVADPNMPAPRAASRRGELVELNWVKPRLTAFDEPMTRATRTGADAQVWELTESARRLMEMGAVPALPSHVGWVEEVQEEPEIELPLTVSPPAPCGSCVALEAEVVRLRAKLLEYAP